jgi:hypothetical protein
VDQPRAWGLISGPADDRSLATMGPRIREREGGVGTGASFGFEEGRTGKGDRPPVRIAPRHRSRHRPVGLINQAGKVGGPISISTRLSTAGVGAVFIFPMPYAMGTDDETRMSHSRANAVAPRKGDYHMAKRGGRPRPASLEHRGQGPCPKPLPNSFPTSATVWAVASFAEFALHLVVWMVG